MVRTTAAVLEPLAILFEPVCEACRRSNARRRAQFVGPPGVYRDEPAIFFHVRRRFHDAAFCPWMVVTDDVALIVGRVLLDYSKKLARVTFDVGDGGEESVVRAEVERRGKVLVRLTGRVGETVDEAPPMLGQRFLNVRGALGLGAPRLVPFRPRERIRSVRRASAALQIERHEREARSRSARRARSRRSAGRPPLPHAARSPPSR